MPDLKLIKNPGYIYDLIFLFFYKYNVDLFPELFEANEEDMKYFSENFKLFEPISDDLYIFFRVASDKHCFFTLNFFHNHAQVLTTEYDLAFLQREVSDYDSFTKNVIKYYFEDLNDNEVNECILSKKRLFEIVKKSDYDDKLKAKLYEFFMDPEFYIRLLQYELMAKDIQLSSYYERNYAKILDVYNELNYELLQERFGFLEHPKTENNIYLSFCLLNKNLLQLRCHSQMLYLIGIDYRTTLERLKKKHIDLIPEQFGAALSDVNRVKMLEVIRQKGECTCKDLEAMLGLPASTAYHHVNTLEKCGVVRARTVKKSMLYSINRKYFATLIEYFQKFLKSAEKQ
ncbi:MAG: winged helix-turn-helix transcriptional regulator [Ruminococcaceae bacterium]|nr:winged helix-turn-helix transcriptional regulator [Oscillospiraceae bacterium]